ncbi:YxlC family protein [Alkalihalobacterium bogoriense]|uniref:YxlC family protein n=1 Tax=Alkalihalobacterium bogoriense TaxID=246272 RepID=UPI0005567DCC|nr:YxlC family protein [Alkalihalobacterium bogoriense]
MEEKNKSEKKIVEALYKMESTIKEQPPTVQNFEHLIVKVQAEQKQKLIKELFIFWFISLFILFIVIWGYAHFFLGLLFLQAIIIIGGLSYVLYTRRSQQMRNDVS